MLLSDTSVTLCKAGSRTGVENEDKFTLSAVTYSIDDCIAKVSIAALQQWQDWKAPQIKAGQSKTLHIYVPQ